MNLVERLEEAFEKKVGGTAMLPASDVLSASVELQRQDERIRALEAQLAEAKRSAEFNFEQYQDAARLLCESSAKVEALEAHNAVLVSEIRKAREEMSCANFNSAAERLAQTLASTPESSLKEIRRAERERCAKVCEKEATEAFIDRDYESAKGAEMCTTAIRQMED